MRRSPLALISPGTLPSSPSILCLRKELVPLDSVHPEHRGELQCEHSSTAEVSSELLQTEIEWESSGILDQNKHHCQAGMFYGGSTSPVLLSSPCRHPGTPPPPPVLPMGSFRSPPAGKHHPAPSPSSAQSRKPAPKRYSFWKVQFQSSTDVRLSFTPHLGPRGITPLFHGLKSSSLRLCLPYKHHQQGKENPLLASARTGLAAFKSQLSRLEGKQPAPAARWRVSHCSACFQHSQPRPGLKSKETSSEQPPLSAQPLPNPA